MRRLIVVVALLVLFLGMTPLSAAASGHGSAPGQKVQGERQDQRGGMHLRGEEEAPADQSWTPPAEPAPTGSAAPAPPPEDIVYEPSWGTHSETDEPCIDLRRIEREGVAHSSLAMDYEHRLLRMMGDGRLRDVEHIFCRDRAADEGGDSPAALAQAFVRDIGIPAPEPRIDPGWALTGMPAYLEIHGQEAFTHEEAIPGFGRLRVAFEPTYFEVDWGDGTTTTVEDGRTGAPYNGPESQQISHTFADVAPENVVRVEARWHATWELGGFRGVVGGMQTSEEFPLEVREMQSVRTSSR
jgi:hypothetical protein